MQMGCPCGRAGTFGGALPYERCCGRYLEDPRTPAPDAESLMRSRYTAYVRGRSDYLLATWDPGTRPAHLRLDARIHWQGLDVREHRVGQRARDDDGTDGDDDRTHGDDRTDGDDRAEVEFVARYTEAGGRHAQLHERSRFVRREGRWFYRDGDAR